MAAAAYGSKVLRGAIGPPRSKGLASSCDISTGCACPVTTGQAFSSGSETNGHDASLRLLPTASGGPGEMDSLRFRGGRPSIPCGRHGVAAPTRDPTRRLEGAGIGESGGGSDMHQPQPIARGIFRSNGKSRHLMTAHGSHRLYWSYGTDETTGSTGTPDNSIPDI